LVIYLNYTAINRRFVALQAAIGHTPGYVPSARTACCSDSNWAGLHVHVYELR